MATTSTGASIIGANCDNDNDSQNGNAQRQPDDMGAAGAGTGAAAGQCQETPRCVSCLSDKVAILVRDKNFSKVMRFYWDSMLLEVKPLEYRVHDLCKECFYKLVDLYDANEMAKMLHAKYCTLEQNFVEKTIKNLQKLETANNKKTPGILPLTKFQQDILERWKDGYESKLPAGLEITGSVSISGPPPNLKDQETSAKYAKKIYDTKSGSTSWTLENLESISKAKPKPEEPVQRPKTTRRAAITAAENFRKLATSDSLDEEFIEEMEDKEEEAEESAGEESNLSESGDEDD